MLQFFEQQSPSFTIQLADFIIPGPITYCPSNDVLIVANGAMEVQAYKYASLAALANTNPQGINAFFFWLFLKFLCFLEKKIQPDWSFIVGEVPQQIYYRENAVKRDRSEKSEIVILGEQSLIILNEIGNFWIF